MPLTVATRTHPGAVRPINEDMVLWDPALGLLAVADGMGGHNAGEVASRLAMDTLQAALADRNAPAVARLRSAMQAANHKVFRSSQDHVDYAGMGTTLTAAVVEGDRAWFASVGDSRLYTKPAGRGILTLRTRDDSVASLIRDSPDIQPIALVTKQMRHLLTSAIGPRPDLTIEVQELTLAPLELMLMTTDGMHGPVGDDVMDMILDDHASMDLETAASHLLDAALGAGGRDNITIALARFTP